MASEIANRRLITSTFKIGAQYTFNEDPAKFVNDFMTPSEIFRSQASVDKFCLLAGINFGEIELIGSDVTTMPNLTAVQIRSDGTTACPEFKIDTWHYIDNSMPSSTTDKCGRYFVGPMWNNNSCAADVVVFAALQLNIGILHVE